MISKKAIVDKAKNYYLSPKGGRKVHYLAGSRLIKWFCGTNYAKTKYFRKKVSVFNAFLKESGLAQSSPRLIHEMLDAFFVKKWRVSAFSNLSDKKFNHLVEIINKDFLDDSYSRGKGVILLSSHFGLSELGISIFPRIGYDDFYTIVGSRGADSEKFTALNADIKTNTLVFDNYSDTELFKVLMKAKHVLNDGGIVHLLGDGYHGKSSSTFRFIEKLRGFRGSYAELALSTDADIIPIFIYPKDHYHIKVELSPPLGKGNEEMGREERNLFIIKQYVDLLEKKWKEYPQFINLGYMEKYMHHVDNEQD